MDVKASIQYLHIAPRKVRVAACLVKGMRVKRAALALRHLPKHAALPLGKLLKSAIANAVENFKLDGKDLYIKDIRVNPGPVLKRVRPRAFGRAATIRRRMSHVALVLAASEAAGTKRLSKKKEIAVRDAAAGDTALMGPRRAGAPSRPGQSAKEKIQKWSGVKRKIFQRKAI